MPILDPLSVRRQALAAHTPVWREQTLPEALAHQAERWGDQPYVLNQDVTWSYREVLERAEVFAKGLRALGVGQGDRVAFVLGDRLCPASIGLPIAGDHGEVPRP
jgi:non-ribosomal peptide synthetase component E (peptide arylation enzyme)